MKKRWIYVFVHTDTGVVASYVGSNRSAIEDQFYYDNVGNILKSKADIRRYFEMKRFPLIEVRTTITTSNKTFIKVK